MYSQLLTNFISLLFIFSLSANFALGKNITSKLLGNQIEEGLNKQNLELVKDLFTKKSFEKFEKQFIYFTKNYQNPKWSIHTISIQPQKIFLDIRINSNCNLSGQKYNVKSKQIVKIETHENKINNYEVINEQSTLKTYNNPLKIKLNSPSRVLTGQRYEINLIIEEPLDNSLIAGGMIAISNNNSIDSLQEYFGIKPYGSLGLFKSIQAPLKPGHQTFSAIIAHPKGIYSLTKKLQVDLR